MSGVTILGITGSIIILMALFEMMRRHRLREKYALIWALVALSIITVAAFPALLIRTSQAIGLEVPANLLFFAASMVIMVLTLQHSSELGRLEERTRTLAEEIALLRLEIDQLHRPGGTVGPASSGAATDPASADAPEESAASSAEGTAQRSAARHDESPL